MFSFEKPPPPTETPHSSPRDLHEEPTRILRKPESQTRRTPEILDGFWCKSLAAAIRLYESPDHDHIAAATDQGIGYKDSNEDRVVIAPDSNSYTVIDGMGGTSDGELAASILAEAIKKEPINIDVAVQDAQREMEEVGISNGGACFLQVYITKDKQERRFLETAQAGDVRMIVIAGRSGRAIITTNDESLVDKLVEDKHLKPDQALYDERRNKVTNAITATYGTLTEQFASKEALRVYPKDRIMIVSDGISDNLTDEEIIRLVKEKTPEDAIRELSRVTGDRMRNAKQIILESPDRAKTGVYSDGYKSKPKPDNRSVVIIDIA